MFFELLILKEIIRIHREFSCCAGCCWFSHCEGCAQKITIEAPPGNLIGTVSQQWRIFLSKFSFQTEIRLNFRGSCWRMFYTLSDAQGLTNFNIWGPCCICDGALCCCCENKFTVNLIFRKYVLQFEWYRFSVLMDQQKSAPSTSCTPVSVTKRLPVPITSQ